MSDAEYRRKIALVDASTFPENTSLALASNVSSSRARQKSFPSIVIARTPIGNLSRSVDVLLS